MYLQLLQAVEGLLAQLTGEVLPHFPLDSPLPHSTVFCRAGAVVGRYCCHGNLATASHAEDTSDTSQHRERVKAQINTAETQGPEKKIATKTNITKETLQIVQLSEVFLKPKNPR